MAMIDGALEVVGAGLGVLYVAYGLVFLALASGFLVHGLVLGYLIASAWRPRLLPARAMTAIEVLYGLVNPFIYLAMLDQSSGIRRQWWLSSAAWGLLIAIWGSRFLLRSEACRESRAARLYVRGLCLAGLACLLAFVLKDMVIPIAAARPFLRPSSGGDLTWGGGALFAVGPLYLIPGVLILRHLADTASETEWRAGRRFFLSVPRLLAWTAGTVMVITLITVMYRPSTGYVERLVSDRRAHIVEAAGHHGVDPALIASVVYVTHRDLTTPFAGYLERAAMAAWLTDPKDNFLLARPVDVSVGIAQIKPLTAMAALVITAGSPQPRYFKQYRGLPNLRGRWRLPRGAVQVASSPFQEPLPKREVVEALFDDRRNLRCAR